MNAFEMERPFLQNLLLSVVILQTIVGQNSDWLFLHQALALSNPSPYVSLSQIQLVFLYKQVYIQSQYFYCNNCIVFHLNIFVHHCICYCNWSDLSYNDYWLPFSTVVSYPSCTKRLSHLDYQRTRMHEMEFILVVLPIVTYIFLLSLEVRIVLLIDLYT